MFISGIASGLDTEQIVQQLMAIERRPLVLMQERKNLLEQQRDAWRDINSRLNNLRERMADLSLASLYDGRTTTSSNGDVATVTAATGASEGSFTLVVHSADDLARAHRVASDQVTDDDGDPIASGEALGIIGEARIGIGDQMADVTVESTDSLADIAAKINGAEVGVTARVIEGHLVVEADETGIDNQIVFDDGPGATSGVWHELGILVGGEIVDANVLQEARDATFEVNGISVTRSSNTIDDLFDGITIQLHGVGQTVVEVTRDDGAVVDAVRSFVEQYNSTVSFMADKSGENAVLQGDTLLMRIQSQLRSDTTAAVAAHDDAVYNQLASIGISVDRHGVMTLDETRLREALADSPQDVQRLFAASSDQEGFDGVVARMEARFQGWLATGTGLLTERQRLFGDRMRAIDDSMERLELRLEIRERNLMRQFIALEEAMAGFQTQASWLDGQLQQLNAMTAAGQQRRG